MAQQPPLAQQPQQQSKMIVDSRLRDIRRRVDVIQKKLADLQELGVPCAFCYTSIRNTGSIFTLGDKRITDVMEKHKNEILCNLIDGKFGAYSKSVDSKSLQEIHLILPPLPGPLHELSRNTLQILINGILKDLGLRWSDPRPNWWPAEIPFAHPRTVSEKYSGSWTLALREILQSVYGYFSYDVETYIASKLEESLVSNETEKDCSEVEYPTTPQSPDGIPKTLAEESQDCITGTYAECSSHPLNESTSLTKVFNSTEAGRLPSSLLSQSHDDHQKKPPPNKLVSSFTVENILMGRQSASSGSSNSPTSTSSPASLVSPTSSAASNDLSSSIIGVNWVSHPPVKYTKFTMLSPNSMSDEVQQQKKKRSSYENNLPASNLSTANNISVNTQQTMNFTLTKNGSPHYSVATATLPQTGSEEKRKVHLGLKRTSSNSHVSHSISSNPLDSPRTHGVTSTAANFSSSPLSRVQANSFHGGSTVPGRDRPSSKTNILTTATAPSAPQQQGCIAPQQTAMVMTKMSTLPVIQTLPTKGLPNVDGSKAVLHQTFPPSQQFVLLMPSNSVPISCGLQAVVYGSPSNPVTSQLKVSQSISRPEMTTIASNSRLVTLQSTPTISNSHCISVASEHGSHANLATTSASDKMSESSSYRPIAPKNKSATSSIVPASSSSPPNSHDTSDKLKLYKRTLHSKPQKLRFHMTTVVKRAKRKVVTSSMTVQSPSAFTGEEDKSPLTTTEHNLDNKAPAASTITRSPNVYSNVYGVHDWKEKQGTRNTQSASTEDEESPPGSPSKKTTKMSNSDQSKGPQAATVQVQDTNILAVKKEDTAGTHHEVSNPARTHSTSIQQKQQLQSRSHLTMSSTRSRGRGRPRATRSYTRRKRELTFHLYEDPASTFRAKRVCK